MNIVKPAKEKLEVHFYTEKVYKKAAIQVCQELLVLQFLPSLLCNRQISNFLTPCLPAVNNIMFDKGYNILRQVSIHYDLVEIKPYRRRFSFKEKRVVDSQLKEDKIGKVTLSAYFSYS